MNQFPVTPISELKKPENGNRIFVKRDDLLPFSFGGNKVRIAREFYLDMCAKNCTGMIFYGDRRSNLCRVLANLCAVYHLPCIMIATTEHASSDMTPFNQKLISSFHVPVISCEKDKIAWAVDEAERKMKDAGLLPYYIYGSRLGTGNEGIAARAYASAYREITAHEEDSGFSYDMIITPYGTGATQGGLICGSLKAKDKQKIVGISISSRTGQRAADILDRTVRDYFEKNRLKVPENYQDAIHLETGYNLGGYGIWNDEVREVIRVRMEEDGIPFDPVYTAKAYLGMSKYLKDRKITGKNILFIHTGGLPLYFDYLREDM